MTEQYEPGPNGILVPKSAETTAERRIKNKGRDFIEKASANPAAMHEALVAAADKVDQEPIETATDADADIVSKTRKLLEMLPEPDPSDVLPTLGRQDVVFLDEMFGGPVKPIRINTTRKRDKSFPPRESAAEMISGGASQAEVESAMEASAPVMYKYDEDEYIRELQAYVASTYTAHYAGDDGVQAFDLIKSAGHGVGFCIGDIIKYAGRFGKKDGVNRKDILKIMHYSLMLLHVVDSEGE